MRKLSGSRGLRTGPVACAGLLAIGLSVCGQMAFAQDNLVAARKAAFIRMYNAPADTTAMLDYARLSIRLRDYEAAVATLERLLAAQPGNAPARLALAQAYAALGVTDVAAYHYGTAARALPPGSAAAAQASAQAGAQTAAGQPSRLSGSLGFGPSYRDEGSYLGFATTAGLTWRQDMGTPDAEDWLTEAQVALYTPTRAGDSDRHNITLRSGPEWRVTGAAYGPRLQPFVEWQKSQGGDSGAAVNAASLGLAYQQPLAHSLTLTGEWSVGRGLGGQSGDDNDPKSAKLGLTWRPDTATRLRLQLERDELSSPTQSRDLTGYRLEWSRAIPAPRFAPSAKPWVIGAFALYKTGDAYPTFYPDAALRVRGYGVSLRAHLAAHSYVDLRVSHIRRASADPVQDNASRDISITYGWEF